MYAEVFSIIGREALSKDLALYLPGLSQTLAFASLGTRPFVLELFEDYILKLPLTALRPALKALILSLLPIIEDETSEDFDRCLHTFNAFRLCFAESGQEFFYWQTLFVAAISNPHRRGGVLAYAIRYLPKLTRSVSEADPANVIISPEPGLLVRCFATGLCDDNSLIQRGFLDLLVTHLPLNAAILQNASYRKDLDVLVRAAITVVLRRDMGLNRRLWAWLTDIDSKTPETATSPMSPVTTQTTLSNDYFLSFGLPSIVRAVQAMLSEPSAHPGPRTIPFRVMLSLMDKWEIGGAIAKASFLSAMESLMKYQSTAPSQTAFDEVFRSANAFFDAIESTTMFSCLSELLHLKRIELISFIVANFSIEQADRVHLHTAALGIELMQTLESQRIDSQAISALLNNLLAIVPLASFVGSDSETSEVAVRLLGLISDAICRFLELPFVDSILSNLCVSFEYAAMLSPILSTIEASSLLPKLCSRVRHINDSDKCSFTIVETISRVVSSLLLRGNDLNTSIQQEILNSIPDLTYHLWDFLQTQTPQHHVAAAENIWRLHDLTFEEEVVDSSILNILIRELSQTNIERFGVLYHHSKTVKRAADESIPSMLRRPALLILDNTLGAERGEDGVQWLLSLPSSAAIFKSIFEDDLTQAQNLSLALQRVHKLIRIVRLSNEHWRAFSSSLDLVQTQDFCLSLIDSKDQIRTKLQNEAFLLLRALYGSDTGNTPPEKLVVLLADKLGQKDADSYSQEAVLDTLLAILTDKTTLPSSMVHVLLQGLSSIPADDRLDKWITLLCNFLPNHQSLLPSLLKATSSFCKRIEQVFGELQSLFDHKIGMSLAKSPDRSIANLLSGLEYVLARAHQQVFHLDAPQGQPTNGTNQETAPSRAQSNNQLTVILCMQDAVRVCANLWAWKSNPRVDTVKTIATDAKSFQYTSTKLRSRSRKILENLIVAEPQECLETLVGIWVGEAQGAILDLLQTLNGARPRIMLPAVFNAIYTRTNPAPLMPRQKSTASIQIGEAELVTFLIEYTSALEDDMLEEIWSDCATFLREVLGNPMPHRQILLKMLRFCAVLSQKMENTSFSEGSRMHKELADICARLFTAIFTIKPSGFDGQTNNEKKVATSEDNILQTLVVTLPHLEPVLSQSDRLNTVYGGIATHITTPALHSRVFPTNLVIEHLEVMQIMSTSTSISKVWRKDILDSFNNPRFFQSSIGLVGPGWLPILKQLQVTEKTLLLDSLNHIAPPAAAGLVLGIGASAARAEADKKTQLELRRASTLMMSTEVDSALPQLQQIFQKIEELLSATPESSPSLATRGDLYLLIRVLLLKTNASNLTLLWPILDAELRSLCKDILAGPESKYTAYSRLQGAKLLDLLLLLRPDEFQLHEWLFVTDTIDAIYPFHDTQPVAYADEIASVLNAADVHLEPLTPVPSARKTRRPWLYGDESRNVKDVDALLAGFFGQLSIRAFEDLYSLQVVDEEAAREDVLKDIFMDVGA